MRTRSVMSVIVLLSLLTAFGINQPALAQTNPVWDAEYYGNSILEGPAVFSQQEGAISHDWGYSSPGSGVPEDAFSARWTTRANLPAGTYRFYALVDDDISITIDFNQIVLNTFGQGRVGQVLTADITLGAGIHHIQVDYRDITDKAYIYLTFANLADNPAEPAFDIPVLAGPWTGQYFNNSSLVGGPLVMRQENNPGGNWRLGSPDASIPADNWSARWTTVMWLNGGTYQISAYADDGVRVAINGMWYIYQWHIASAETYEVMFTVPEGYYYFVIEFSELSGQAFLDYELTRTRALPATLAYATVTTYRLNVRSIPDPFNGAILTKISRNETYPVMGQNADGTWIEISVNGLRGWVNRSYVLVTGAGALPVTYGGEPQETGFFVNAYPNEVNIRSGPGTNYAIVGRMDWDETAPVVGRNANSSWWQIKFNGVIGWVSAQYSTLEGSGFIPITG